MNHHRYRPYLAQFPVSLPNRTWPTRQIIEAPLWCSVDLRDGNQALINPMDLSKKLTLYRLLVEIGFKEIEIGFPSASQTEFDFARALLEEQLVGPTIIPQVLCQAREHLIERTFEAMQGFPQWIFHLYNSTSELQRRVVFEKDKKEILYIAVTGTRWVKERAKDCTSKLQFQYSPESFTGTELSFSLEVCEAVINAWQPATGEKVIINLPATVEMATPNIYADQIEWFLQNISCRDQITLSVHPHNDRGTAVAATELALMAGADRVEGTLFGNGERTGNVDLLTLALNMMTQGVDPKLDISSIDHIREVAESCTELPIHPRHPYAGELVFTAFSGSHQDAINKGFKYQAANPSDIWEVPYLPIDPHDIGREYEAIIRINSQSGKGGVAYVLASEFGCELPKAMHPELGNLIQKLSEKLGTEVPSAEIWRAFEAEYLKKNTPLEYLAFRTEPSTNSDSISCSLTVRMLGEETVLRGKGNGPVDAALHALQTLVATPLSLEHYSQHSRSVGSDAQAAAYISLAIPGGSAKYGVGIHPNTNIASILALVSAYNRLF